MDVPPFRFLLLLAAMMGYGVLIAQELRGRVVQPSGEPLAFVTVRIDDSATDGVLTDIDGWFKVKDAAGLQSLAFSYLGYAARRVEGAALQMRPLVVVMEPAALGLPEVEVVAGENPAHRIIRAAAERRENHDPFRYTSWVCTLYNKVSVDPLHQEERFAEKLAGQDSLRATQSRLRRDTLLKEIALRHLLFMESAVERSWLRPGRTRDRVLQNRVSGFEDSRILALAHALQPFQFHEDHITLLETSYLNPVSRGSEDRYRFVLEDTLWQGADTIWVIRFEPRAGASFDGFRGQLHIHGGDFAIRNVIAEPAEPARMRIRLEQQYRCLEDGRWFPDQLIFTFSAPHYPDPTLGLSMQGKTYIGEVRLDAPLRPRDFDPEQPLILEEDALTRDEARWAALRPAIGLDDREDGTYHFMDSLGKAEGFDRLSPWLDVLNTGVVALSPKIPVRLDLRGFLRANYYENTRLTLGLTNHPSKALTQPRTPVLWRVWGAYGFRDRGWKYGGEAALHLYRPLGLRLEGSFREDLAEPGAPFPPSLDRVLDRRFYAPRMDRLREWKAGVHLRPLPSLNLALETLFSRWSPDYEYTFLPEGERRDFDFRELRLGLRFAPYRLNPLTGPVPVDRRTKWPVLELLYSRSLEGLFDGAPRWQRAVASLGQEFMVPGLGRCTWRVEGGMAGGDLPMARLFTVVRPPASAFRYILVPQAFLTPRDFLLYDRFVNIFWRQDLGYRLWQTRRSRPLPALAHHASYGSLNRPEQHAGLEFRTPPRGFHESGIIVDELLRLNYVDIADLTLGFAVFWPWNKVDRPSGWWPEPRLALGFRF